MKLVKLIKSAIVASAVLVGSFAYAADVGVNASENDLAIHGYDPVSYFTKGRPTKGSSKYTATYKGAIFQFASESNRDSFKKDPEQYAPQFGGFCAMGVALNRKLDVDPTAWHIEDNKLYLNLNKDVQKKWMEDVPGNLDTAFRNWNGIQAVPDSVLADE